MGVPVLEKLLDAGIVPQLVICSPDRRAGRGLRLVPPKVKELAVTHSIEVFQPESLRDTAVRQRFEDTDWDLFVVVAYNHILPESLITLPKKGCVNLHPSLLPALRGPSPIRTAILNNQPEVVGVSIMLLDEKMDHGPILEQAAYEPRQWPIPGTELDSELADMGGLLLAETIPDWLIDAISPQEQEHNLATYTKKFNKGENELDIDPHNLPSGQTAQMTLCKIHAWVGIGDTFFVYKGKRIKVKTADLTDTGQLRLQTVIPEGKSVMSFDSYVQSLAS